MGATCGRGRCERIALAGVLAILVSAECRAHGDVHEGIVALDREIEEASARSESESRLAALYFQRAQLQALDASWDAALADLARASGLDPSQREIDSVRGRVLLDAGRAAEAEVVLRGVLAVNPDDHGARVARARSLVALERPLEAAEDFGRATTLEPAASPDIYLEWAHALQSAGPAHLGSAIDALDAGIAEIGPVVALQMLAVELESEAGRVDAALARLDRLASGTTRQERWLVQRGELLEKAGRRTEAAAAFEAARIALDRLPAHRRRTPAMTQLDARIRDATLRLASMED